jgi:hypothetical protein
MHPINQVHSLILSLRRRSRIPFGVSSGRLLLATCRGRKGQRDEPDTTKNQVLVVRNRTSRMCDP